MARQRLHILGESVTFGVGVGAVLGVLLDGVSTLGSAIQGTEISPLTLVSTFACFFLPGVAVGGIVGMLRPRQTF